MNHETLGKMFLNELEQETKSTRKCLERIPEKLFTWKPHERSMTMGNLTLVIAEIPKWISTMIEKSEIDFATFKHFEPKSSAELANYFDENVNGAKNALKNVPDEGLSNLFYLKNKGVTVFSSRIDDSISSTINHMVHHRGQLTVYMRLNDIPVPSIYGPSADEQVF